MSKKPVSSQPVADQSPIDQATIDALLAGLDAPAPQGESSEGDGKSAGREAEEDQGVAHVDLGSKARRATVSPVEFTPFSETPSAEMHGNIELLLDVVLNLTVELGRSRMTVREVLGLGPGSVIVLDKLAGEAVDISVNGTFIARGEVVVVDEKFGVRVTEIVSPAKRMASAV